MVKLTKQDIDRNMESVPGWTRDADALAAEFTFKDFLAAFAFMTDVAALAQSANHHPDWSNSHNKVKIHLSSHEAGGLTLQDFELASAISEVHKPD
jgi:4a-hydroxytetrahydrobiopterin dehydratase